MAQCMVGDLVGVVIRLEDEEEEVSIFKVLN